MPLFVRSLEKREVFGMPAMTPSTEVSTLDEDLVGVGTMTTGAVGVGALGLWSASLVELLVS